MNITSDHIPAVTYAYYEGNWKALPDFSSLKPLKKGYARTVSVSAVYPRDKGFGIVFNGVLRIPGNGNYTFFLTSDDGSRLFLRNKLVIDHDGIHGFDTREATVNLKYGRVPFRVEYFQATGGKGLRLMIKGDNMKDKVPVSLLLDTM